MDFQWILIEGMSVGFEWILKPEDTSSELVDSAMRDGELCEACPEGCVVVLLLQAAAFPRDFPEALSLTLPRNLSD